MEKPISFTNNLNHRLYGILHIPENEYPNEKRIGINLLNPGLKNRVAPNRLNVKLARKLCDMGFFVLRFDPTGIGDSEGKFNGENEPSVDLWERIQKGFFVDDVLKSNIFFMSEVELNEIILIGQCGAGVTAGLLGVLDKCIKKMILIDTPFRISSSDIDLSQSVIDSYNNSQLLKEQLSDFLQFNWLSNLFSNGIKLTWLRDKIRVVNKVFNIKNIIKSRKKISDRFNNRLSDSLLQFIKKGNNIYFLFAENDYSLREFNNDFRYNILEKNGDIKRYDLDIINNANHIYTEMPWQEELFNKISKWIISQIEQ